MNFPLPLPLAACVDTGGTKTLIGLVDSAGNVLARQRFPAPNELPPTEQITDLVRRLRQLALDAKLAWERVIGLGYSTAGMLNAERTLVYASPNQGNWRDVPFKALLQEAFGLPAQIEMDANAAALGEAWLGAGNGCANFLYVIVGTGVGSGIVIDGKLLHGFGGTAGEIGHTTIDLDGPRCNCGNFGCLEVLAAGPAIARRAQAAITQGEETLLSAALSVTAESVFAAARQGDQLACAVIAETVGYLAVGLTNAIHLLNPQVIALGGGVAVGGADLLLEALRRAVRQRCGGWVNVDGTQIVLSRLGDDAGLIGAARLVFQET